MQQLPASVDLPALEHRVLARWRQGRVFERSLEQTAGGEPWVFYEGPPTANGKPGTHHVEARVFKDLFPRFQTMRGRHVPRKGGWDCHGLPVELAVEKELGFSGKQDIEAYGVAEFNAKCRESVLRHVDEFERMTTRMGYWCDLGDAYRTMDASYVESVWWSLQQIADKGLLVEDHRVAPYCPRCGTGLSDHEVAQGYQTVTDPSVYVRFPVTSGPLAGLEAKLLVWTTTPWTLVSNTAVAVNPGVTYVAARAGDEVLVVAEPLLHVLGDDVEVLERFPGTALEHTTYARPFDLVEIPDAHYVGVADYVTVDSGTGLVHQSPAFGAEDMQVARKYGLPVVNPVRANGTFEEGLPLVGGLFFKAADEPLVKDLRERGLLFRELPYEHSYPHCWRCDTALLYYALPSWYVRTTAIKDRLVEENERTTWYPSTIKHGRYGDWLDNNIDWALSRNRYWGTPLPIWRCTAEKDHWQVFGSLAELGEAAGQELSALDPHRPYVDDVVVPCRDCGAEARRVPEVIDGWYDSGAMPFAQVGYPHSGVEPAYPAQFIAEAIDQTRGWFYTLMTVGTLVFDRSSYETVLCLGHILDGEGRKMSKHLGNVLDPHEIFERQGADALRWYMLCGGSPWSARRVGHEQVDEVVRKVLLTYWNTASFLSLYAGVNDWSPGGAGDAQPTLLDRWVLSQVHATALEVTAALEDFDSLRAGRRLAQCIDDVSNWYVRTSRRRFWDGDPMALGTLHECLWVLTLLMAPFTPFVTDEVWDALYAGQADGAMPDSVHLAPWPSVDGSLVDEQLDAQVALVRRLVDLGRQARAESKVKTRQPLGRAHGERAGLAGAARPTCRRWSPPSSTSSRSSRWPVTSSTSRPRRTSGRSASASARACRRWPRRWPRPTRRSSPPACATGRPACWSTASPSPSARRRSSSPRPRAPAGRSPAAPARPSRWTWRSRRSCAAPGSCARRCASCRTPARPAGWRSATASSCGGRPTASWPRRCRRARAGWPRRCSRCPSCRAARRRTWRRTPTTTWGCASGCGWPAGSPGRAGHHPNGLARRGRPERRWTG